MSEESRDRLLFWSLAAFALILLLAVALFTFEPCFVPSVVYEWAGTLAMGSGLLYFLGIPGLLIIAIVIGIAVKVLRSFSD